MDDFFVWIGSLLEIYVVAQVTATGGIVAIVLLLGGFNLYFWYKEKKEGKKQ